ncbi:hypothetical protein [Streptomyces sp. H27-C3]|uniref:hypothetical protein n=1 Tax=Streptomyces sp. H27-C3 TaxID=3046305 RepID=UPI0024B8CD4E|nr:hypothetical protein [Streptomyces sp. H27-C3]MDJ0460758.1 hypothetical protein [Streptomyces sp. H27-C3]
MTTASPVRLRSARQIPVGAGLLLLASAAFHTVVLVLVGGPWDGPVSWRKPITFGLSFGISVLTITWICRLLPLATRTRTLLLGAFTAASLLETSLITLQAWRGVPSHFNTETTFDTVVARALTAGGITLIAFANTGRQVARLSVDSTYRRIHVGQEQPG